MRNRFPVTSKVAKVERSAGKEPEENPASAVGIGRASLVGGLHMLGSAGLVKLASLGCQLLLGFLLLPRDYAVFAIASSILATVSVFQLGGLQQVLVQKHHEYQRFAGVSMFLSLSLNSLLALTLACVAGPVSRGYSMPELQSLLQVIAVTLPVSAIAEQICAQLQIRLRFRSIAAVEAFAGLLVSVLMVICAWRKMGPLSFVVPQLAVAFLRLLSFAWLVDYVPWPTAKQVGSTWPFLKAGVWLSLGAFATTIMEQGQFLVISFMANPEILGAYFFGFRLADQTRSLIGFNIGQVLMVAFSKLNDSLPRLQDAFLTTLRCTALGVVPLSFLGALLIGHVESLVWHGKWASSMPAAQLLSVATPMAFMSIIGRTAMKSRGKFGVWAITAWADALGTVFAALVGVLGKSVLSIAIALAAYKMVAGFLQLLCGAWCLSTGPMATAANIWRPFAIAVAAGTTALALTRLVEPGGGSLMFLSLLLATFSAVYAVGTLCLNRLPVGELRAAIRRRPSARAPQLGVVVQ